MDSVHHSADIGIVNSTTREFTMGPLTKPAIDNHSTIHTGHTDIVNSTPEEFTLDTLMKQTIINHPKYAHLFSGIGHFKCRPVHITMRRLHTSTET